MLRDESPPNAEPAATASFTMSNEGIPKRHHVRDSATRTTENTMRTCLCNDSEACLGLTAAFSLLNDPRKGFVAVPSGSHESREEFLKPLSVSKTISSDYIAAHHFNPKIVLHQHCFLSDSGVKSRATMMLPKTISEDEAMRLGVDVQGWHGVVDDQGTKQFMVIPNYPLENTRADMTALFTSKCKSNKKCLCGNVGNRCKALTATFRMLHDPRRGFVRIPRYHSGSNHVRNAYLRHLFPHHFTAKETPTKYVAAHHFEPSIVLAHEEWIGRPDEKSRAVPRTLTKEQVMKMGVNVDACETMEDENGGRVYIVAPCYPMEKQEANVTLLLNHIYQEGIEGDTDDDILKEDSVTLEDSIQLNDEVESASPELRKLEDRGNGSANTSSPADEPSGDIPLPPHGGSASVPEHGNVMESVVVSSAEANGSLDDDDHFPPSYKEHIASIKALYQEKENDENVSVEPIIRRSDSPLNDKKPNDKDMHESLPEASTSTEQVVPDEPEAVAPVDVTVPVDGGGMVETKEPLDDGNSKEKANQSATGESHSTDPPNAISAPAMERDEKSLDQNDSTAPRAIESCQEASPAKLLVDASKEHSSPNHPRVNFGTLSIREYPIIPGDNPGGKRGPPLTIDWKHQKEVNVKLDSFEASRPKRRTQTEFDMPPKVRLKLLRNSGHTLVEIQRYTKQANIVRNRRRSTNGLSHLFVFSQTRERLTRRLSNLTFRRAQKQKERDFLRRSLQMDQRDAKEKSGLTEIPSFEEEHRAPGR